MALAPRTCKSYPDEFCYRLNRRDAPLDLLPQLNRCLLYTPPITYCGVVPA